MLWLSLMTGGLLHGPGVTWTYLEGLRKLWVSQALLISKGE